MRCRHGYWNPQEGSNCSCWPATPFLSACRTGMDAAGAKPLVQGALLLTTFPVVVAALYFSSTPEVSVGAHIGIIYTITPSLVLHTLSQVHGVLIDLESLASMR